MTSRPTCTRSVVLARRPDGNPVPEDFSLIEEALPALNDGELLLVNEFVSLDAGFRNWMDEDSGDAVLPAMALGAPVMGLVLGTVLESRHRDFEPGTRLMARLAWQEHTVTDATDFLIRLPEPLEADAEHYLGILGDTGLSAFFGLRDIGRPKDGETVLVSAAAGAVGSIAGQLARIMGARAVGISSGPEKLERLKRDLGYDAVIDRRKPLPDQLASACPEGVDVYFDNVGGPMLETVIDHLAEGARVVLCGAVSTYGQAAEGPKNLFQLVTRQAAMSGFLTHTRAEEYPEARAELARWLKEGKLVAPEHRLQGIEQVAQAFCDLFAGRNFGKTLVEL
ncbi:MAG: NADP-dependent oxidoreductase [Pseudomonadota bacterium]